MQTVGIITAFVALVVSIVAAIKVCQNAPKEKK